MSTIFLEQSFVVAIILNVKNKYFDENFVDFKELNYMTNLLQQIFNNNNLNVIITNEIDQIYFQINDVIVMNSSNNISFEEIRNRYQGYCSINVLKILWNDQLILDEIIKFKLSSIENARKRKQLSNTKKEKTLSLTNPNLR